MSDQYTTKDFDSMVQVMNQQDMQLQELKSNVEALRKYMKLLNDEITLLCKQLRLRRPE